MSALKYSAVALATLLSTTVSAKQFWSDNSFSLLKGSSYEVGDEDRTVYTFEHASGHSWGSIFTFVDRIHSDNTGEDETYGELGFSFNVMEPKDSFIKSVYVTPQWEFGENMNNLLIGAGVNLDVPGSKFFNVNLYQRNNEFSESNQQLTLVWAFPFADGFVYDGFLDAVNGTDDGSVGGYNFTSQLKYDLGQHVGVAKGKLFVGVEHTIWNNKFGINQAFVPFEVDENNTNLLIKWHL